MDARTLVDALRRERDLCRAAVDEMQAGLADGTYEEIGGRMLVANAGESLAYWQRRLVDAETALVPHAASYSVSYHGGRAVNGMTLISGTTRENALVNAALARAHVAASNPPLGEPYHVTDVVIRVSDPAAFAEGE